MAQARIDHLIINSPFREPATHWHYDRETRTFSTADGRRPAGYVRATPDTKGFDDPGVFIELALVNRIRERVREWRKSYAGVGLVFVTQLPQHLPRQIFGLVNSYILHKVTDPQVVAALKKTVSNVDESLWTRLPGLVPGQAIVSFPQMTRPLMVAIDPSPAELLLVD